MKSYLDIIADKGFRNFVESRLKEVTPSYCLPTRFPLLFRYRPLSKFAVDDILNRKLTLTTIGEFNDLFDGSIHFPDVGEAANVKAEEQWKKLCHYCTSAEISDLAITDEYLIKIQKYILQKQQRNLFTLPNYLGTYVCCLSSSSSSMLMWSHYADSNKGMCIAYDFNTLPPEDVRTKLIFPVAYSNIPINVLDLLEDSNNKICAYHVDAAVQCVAVNKSQIWKDENEWRIILEWEFRDALKKYEQIEAHIIPSKILLGYHFLKNFFYYNFSDEEKCCCREKLELFLNLLDYVQQNYIKLVCMTPQIGTYMQKEIPLDVRKLKTFITEFFIHNEPDSMDYYNTVHNSFMDKIYKKDIIKLLKDKII